MTKKDLTEKLYERLRDYSKKDLAYAVDIMFSAMTEALKRDERIEIRGFGNFTVRTRRPRRGRNPKTGTSVDVPVKKFPFFKVGKELKKTVDYPK
ncbi:MAG TPA: HU family DNA-binding protein [Syntrophales bacterium]|jgi:integration host factor beta subunit|nr:HU family DNA-binding protein [Syntrophales bacterium]HRT62839.1 HU family DNA-binding protein [Syntrophales bacterium]